LNRARIVFRLALAGALVASLGLAACGRKGALEPPPGASLEGVPQANMPGMITTPAPATPPQADNFNGQPAAPKGPKKKIPLDVLLN
jgi:predicted small lipoprotein YifL